VQFFPEILDKRQKLVLTGGVLFLPLNCISLPAASCLMYYKYSEKTVGEKQKSPTENYLLQDIHHNSSFKYFMTKKSQERNRCPETAEHITTSLLKQP